MPVLDTIPLAPGVAQWPVWSTTARLVVTEPTELDRARALVEDRISAVDRACSRFRPDSELARIQKQEGPGRISPLLRELVQTALTAARRTDGDVDPTVGACLEGLGYDRDITAIGADGGPVGAVHTHGDWRTVHLAGEELTLAPGTRLDLGATAKAYAADWCARDVARALGIGVLVSLGGDIATAGTAPEDGWQILVQDQPGDPADTIRVPAGTAVATSSTVNRRWRRGGHLLHHIIDPRCGQPAEPVWRTATVAADSCVNANTATTATLVRGRSGLAWLRGTGLPARLVTEDLAVLTVNGWPDHE